MIIDVFLMILLLIAVVKGYSRGLIVAIFSFFAIIIGLAAAMKLSVSVAGWLNTSTNINTKWLPFISFTVVIVSVMILVRWLARLLQKSVEFVMLGWLNRIGGIMLYAFLYITIFSVFIFYANKLHLLKEETILSSKTYSYIQPLGPKAIDMIAYVLPVFKNIFEDLTKFFGSLSYQSSYLSP